VAGQVAALKVVQAVVLAYGLALLVVAITLPLDRQGQTIFGLAVFAAAAIIGQRSASRRTTIFLIVISVTVSTRYMWWRITQTLHFDNPLALMLGTGLLMAELYAWIVLVLGYVQCAWPLERSVRELSGPPTTWPTVDVMIPTYNESLDLVQDTVFAAMDQDYPRDRFKVYILDDGRRPEFEAFAKAVGCGYLTRDNNKHAKAGNLNAAMKKSTGELLCIFDCDHVATRAFLQLTVGWFQADPKLALLQTPHYFYSPDPVQRNVVAVRDIPGEGDLFYGVVQKGNDFWNATFFCGSCALIRRSALAATNGFAGETVTEDAHTALKLQRMGWNTAYLNARLSAGLATERLSMHVGQRARWARGMTQIFRIENPMLGPGLSLPQRICYLNAMLHFQFPLPRIVFLTSPLAYMLLGQNIIAASALTILAYAAPHLLFAVLVNERVQGKYRRSFWGEVYETLISFHLVGPTILPLIDPKKGKFNVTDKGGILEEGFFDYKIVMPHLITIALLIIGIMAAIVKLSLPRYFDASLETSALNILWSLLSLLVLFTSVAVARETRQVRTRAYLDVELPVKLYFDDGHILPASTINISVGGMAVAVPDEAVAGKRIVTHVEVEAMERTFGFSVKTLESGGGRLRLMFTQMTLEARRELVRVVMGRADAWPAIEEAATWSAWQSFLDLCRAALSIVFWWRSARDLRAVQAPNPTLEPKIDQPKSKKSKKGKSKSGAPGAPVAGAAAVLLAMAISLTLPAKPLAQTRTTTAPSADAVAAQKVAAAGPTTPGAPAAGGVRTVSLSLEDLNVNRPVRLVTTLGEAGIPFSIRQDEVVTQAQIILNFAYSPQLLQDISHMTVLINDEVVGTIPLLNTNAGGVTVTLPIDPGLFLVDNTLGFRFVAHYTKGCEDPLHSVVWSNISNTRTKLQLTLQRLSTGETLSRLPAPFFDSNDPQPLKLPFVFPSAPSNEVIGAAAAVSSYFGMNASFRGYTFPVAIGELPSTDAVVFARSGAQIGDWTAPAAASPVVSVIRNPHNPYASLLVISGSSDGDVLAAARVLSMAPKSLSGQTTQVSPLPIVKRQPYDAPRWVDIRRPVRLGQLVSPLALGGLGLRPGLLTAEFRTAPDLFFWPETGAKLSFGYRYPNGSWMDFTMSRLDVLTNDKYIRSFPLRPAGIVAQTKDLLGLAVSQQKAQVEVPGYNIFGQNQLQFFYDLHVLKKACEGDLPDGVRVGIDADSKLDLTGAHHFSRMPDLSFFASSGFPFSRVADLSETVAIIPQQPQASDIEALLAITGRLGDATGAPSVGLTVARPDQIPSLKERDVLIVGPLTVANQAAALFQNAPVRFDNGRLRVASDSMIDRLFARFGSNIDQRDPAGADAALVTMSDFAGVSSWRSPFDPGRVVVAVMAASSQRLPPIIYALARPAANAAMQGDLSIATDRSFTSFRVQPGFWSGKLPWLVALMWWTSSNPLLLAVALLLAAVIIGGGIWGFMLGLERVRLRDVGERR
jgi:cellulose synthase (UDP-forming)